MHSQFLSQIGSRSKYFRSKLLNVGILCAYVFVLIFGQAKDPVSVHAKTDNPPIPLPGSCVGVTPGQDTPACCAFGYVYANDLPVPGASVHITSSHGSVDLTTAAGVASSDPYFRTDLSSTPLLASNGDILTLTASYNGHVTTRTWVVQPGGQQVDLALTANIPGSSTPKAAFSASPAAGGAAPLAVQFINSSTGSYTSLTWNFGDGSSSSLENPTHTYLSVGDYIATLNISGPAGNDSIQSVIHVYDAVFTVTNTNDTGTGSLRQALESANVTPGTRWLVQFNIPLNDPGYSSNVFTIRPLSGLPVLVKGITVDGSTQTAYTGDTNPMGPEVVLNGGLLASGNGLRLGDNNTVKGLVINGFPNGGGVGIYYLWDMTPSGNQVLDNYIGTDATGMIAVPNGSGIFLSGYASPSSQAVNNTIEGNLISGNNGLGIAVGDASNNYFIDNRIGTDRTGQGPLANHDSGIRLTNAGASGNQIKSNVIAYNDGDGILIMPDYRYSNVQHLSNAIRKNSIFANTGMGINLLPPPFGFLDGMTPNDPGDGDMGANKLQNFPVVSQVTTNGATTTVSGTLNSTPNQAFEIELFSNQSADPSGYGEGQTYLTTLTVNTDGSGNSSFTTTLPGSLTIGSTITATATDVDGNTSEFSNALALPGLAFDAVFTVTNTNDSGAGSLRQALESASSAAGTHWLVQFNIPLNDPGYSSNVFTIRPLSVLPALLNGITVDGSTQTAYTGDTNPVGPEVMLNGGLQASGSGLHLGDNNTVKDLVINGFLNGAGVEMSYQTDMTPSGNQVLGDYIGTDATGMAAVPNGSGIAVSGYGSPTSQAVNNTIEGNLISGNNGLGIAVGDASNNYFIDNRIGTDRTGQGPLANHDSGIRLTNAGASGNQIKNNVIAYNDGDGILIMPDYRFSSVQHLSNAIRKNSIFANTGMGINLLPPPFGFLDGMTPNDPGDGDMGANKLQNFPVVTAVSTNSSTTTISGTLNSTANQSFEIELFSNQTADPSGYGEGQTYLTTLTVNTNGSGNTSFTTTLPILLSTGSSITATATDVDGNTSEFSNTLPVSTPPSAGFTSNVVNGPAPLDVQFTDLSSGNISDWLWFFGDGSSSGARHPFHHYTSEGIYSVSLRVSGPAGSSTLTRSNFITVQAPSMLPSADFTANPPSGPAPLAVHFTDQSSGEINTWQWIFGDGASSNLQNPDHVYTATGTYPVTLKVTGPSGSDQEVKGGYINVVSAPPTPEAWTYILYFAGDNELTKDLTDAIDNLEQLPNNPNLNIVVLMDGWQSNNTHIYHIQYNPAKGIQSAEIQTSWNSGELDTGDPTTLINFVNWARSTYPAEHYFLSIADHGRGTTGIGWDYTSNNDYLSANGELKSALKTITNNGAQKIDVLFFDACLMAMTEDAYEVKDYVNYIVASENLGWGVFDYKDYASNVGTSTTPKQLAVDVANDYFTATAGYPATISVIDTSAMDNLGAAVDQLSQSLIAYMDPHTDSISILKNVRQAVQTFDSTDYSVLDSNDEYIDLYHFASLLFTSVNAPAVKNAAQAVMTVVNHAVVIEMHRSGKDIDTDNYWNLDNAKGISLYFPLRRGGIDYLTYVAGGNWNFVSQTTWDDFLINYFSGNGSLPVQPGDPGVPPMKPLSAHYSTFLPVAKR